jgi:hypothetical protein
LPGNQRANYFSNSKPTGGAVKISYKINVFISIFYNFYPVNIAVFKGENAILDFMFWVGTNIFVMNQCFRIFFRFWIPLLFFYGANLNAQTSPAYYYIAPGGDDSNPGTELLPWKTLAKAASMATAGVTIFIRQGIYKERLVPVNSGTAEAPITFASYPGDTVTISGAGMTSPEVGWGLIFIDGLNYVRISGLRVKNSLSTGINIGNSSYITIEKNYIDSTYDSGISTYICNNIVIDANEIVNACFGATDESISIGATNLFEIINNHVHDAVSIGIDTKVGSSNGIVTKNEVYNLSGAIGIYIEAWNGHEFNIDVFDNISHDNTIGFAVTSENEGLIEAIKIHQNIAYENHQRGFFLGGWGIGKTHPLRNIKVYGNESYENGFGIEIGSYTGTTMENIEIDNNLVYLNKGAGIRVSCFDWPLGEYVLRNIAIVNNTLFENGTMGNGWDAENFGMNIFNISPENMLIRNNIISNSAVGTIHVSPEIPADSVTIDYNFFDGFRNFADERAGTNPVYGSPSFVDTLMNDYHLQDTSAAIDKGDPDQEYNDPEDPDKSGYALYPAQATLRNDMGAYGGPYASSWDPASYASIPPAPTPVSPFNGATGVPTTLLLGWNGPLGATSYHLQVSTSSDFSSLVIDSSDITGQSYGIRDLENNTSYYWRVNATNAVGTGSYSSTWNFTTKGPTSLEQHSSDIPNTSALYQNYPNPFDQFTTIEFSLAKKSPVKLTIFDAQGIVVEVLVNQDLSPGQYHTKWIPHNNTSGNYFCQLQTSESIFTKKLLLQR